MSCMKGSLVTAVLMVPFALTACGGGGGGGGGGSTDTTYSGTTQAVTIDDANAEEVASSGMGSVSTADTTMQDSTGTVTTASGAQVADDRLGVSVAVPALKALAKVEGQPADGGAMAVGATQTESYPCDSGSGSMTLTDTAPEEELNAGDSMSMSFEDCTVTDSTGATVGTFNGGLSFHWHGYDATTGEADLEAVYDHLKISSDGEHLGTHGSLRIKSGAFAGSMPYESNAAAAVAVMADLDVVNSLIGKEYRLQNAGIYLTDSDADLATVDYPAALAYHGEGGEYTSCRGDLGCITVDSSATTSFQWPDGTSPYPATGRIRFVGQDGSAVALDADTGDRATVDVYINGEAHLGKNWDSLSGSKLHSVLGGS